MPSRIIKHSTMTGANLKVDLYPTHNGQIAVVNYTASTTQTHQAPRALPMPVILLDNSGSMGEYVQRLGNWILPKMLQNLGYKPTDKTTLITFESSSVVYETTVAKLATLRLGPAGGTNLSPGIHNLAAVLMSSIGGEAQPNSIRLLTVSDGEISDAKQSLLAAENLKQWTDSFQLNIESQAVRFMSSTSANPDTRALCSLLQLNTTAFGTAIDVLARSTVDSIASQMASVFSDVGQRNVATLESATGALLFKQTPWTAENLASVKLVEGINCLWLDHPLSSQDIRVKGIPESAIQVVEHSVDAVEWKVYEGVLKDKIDAFINQIKVLKVLDTAEAQSKVANIRAYFEGLERFLSLRQVMESEKVEDGLLVHGLAKRVSRLKAMIQKRSQSILQQLLEIANDSKVGKLNSAQQAAYLRSVSVSKTSKGLAKRAMNSDGGLEFDSIARAEVVAMHAHLHELDGVDDSQHEKSFYSFDTTLGGIQTVCSLVDDQFIHEMTAHEILEFLNIVGIPCENKIGDYPDPSTFHVDKIYLGSFISLSDVLVHQVQGHGQKLFVPGSDQQQEIMNVIPYFEDTRIAAFYRKYAPKLLEYTASIGMRRVIADVPMTFGYTLLAGFWKCIQLCKTNKTEVLGKLLVCLSDSVTPCVGGYFKHLLPLFDPCMAAQCAPGRCVDIGGDGVYSCLVPLMHFIKLDSLGYQQEMLPKVLHALYSYESWNCIRKLYRHQENGDEIIQDMLDKLLGVNVLSTRTVPQPLFEFEPEPVQFHDTWRVNEQYFKELRSRISHVEDICLLGPVLSILADSAATASEKVERLRKQVPVPSVTWITQSLRIEYSYNLFQVYNLVQALVFKTKQSRINDEGIVLLQSLGDAAAGVEMISQYVRERHEQQYQLDMKAKREQETAILTSDLVNLLVRTSSINVFCDSFRDGLQKGECKVEIANTSSPGYPDLMAKLLDVSSSVVPLQVAKVWGLLLGRKPANKNKHEKEGEVIWNNGNVLAFVDLCKFQAVFDHHGKEAQWKVARKEYMDRRQHAYRFSNVPNQHGHSNLKPSFWALGYESVEQMKGILSKVEFEAYRLEHKDCCGF
ncbi:hypothetical protein HDU98_007322 [Podochytrium sp. JEL0797]|nr:hypothetical protein HDU98_007322 [Podochytrium sp. JEL0797]